MRAFATELAVNLRKESLEQMATAALQAKLAEMTVRGTTRPHYLSGTFSFGSDTTTQPHLSSNLLGCLRFHSSMVSCLTDVCCVLSGASEACGGAGDGGVQEAHQAAG